ncbi:hypothetical protein KIY57_15990 [Heyndrickxia coagulans]|nr:hypothetical protein KIY57_15990 [Heyndrickxia coagulans]
MGMVKWTATGISFWKKSGITKHGMNTVLPGSKGFCQRIKERCRRMARIIMMKKQTGLSNSVITGKPESTLHLARRYLHFTMISCKKRTKTGCRTMSAKTSIWYMCGPASGP